jgi:hypothetical protein
MAVQARGVGIRGTVPEALEAQLARRSGTGPHASAPPLEWRAWTRLGSPLRPTYSSPRAALIPLQ